MHVHATHVNARPCVTDHPQGHNVTFHYNGLGAHHGKVRRTFLGYGELGGQFIPLDGLISNLGHTFRPLELLKLDCEGCEWQVCQIID